MGRYLAVTDTVREEVLSVEGAVAVVKCWVCGVDVDAVKRAETAVAANFTILSLRFPPIAFRVQYLVHTRAVTCGSLFRAKLKLVKSMYSEKIIIN